MTSKVARAAPSQNEAFRTILVQCILKSDMLDACSILMLAGTTPWVAEQIHFNRQYLTLRDSPCKCGKHKCSGKKHTLCPHKKPCCCTAESDLTPYHAAYSSIKRFNTMAKFFGLNLPFTFDSKLQFLTRRPDSFIVNISRQQANVELPDGVETLHIVSDAAVTLKTKIKFTIPESVSHLNMLSDMMHMAELSQMKSLTSITMNFPNIFADPFFEFLPLLTNLITLNLPYVVRFPLNILPENLEIFNLSSNAQCSEFTVGFNASSKLKHFKVGSFTTTGNLPLVMPHNLETLVQNVDSELMSPAIVYNANLKCLGHIIPQHYYTSVGKRSFQFAGLDRLTNLQVYLQLPTLELVHSSNNIFTQNRFISLATKTTILNFAAWFVLRNGQYCPSTDFLRTLETTTSHSYSHFVHNKLGSDLPPNVNFLSAYSKIFMSDLANLRSLHTSYDQIVSLLNKNISIPSLRTLSLVVRSDRYDNGPYLKNVEIFKQFEQLEKSLSSIETLMPNLKTFELVFNYHPLKHYISAACPKIPLPLAIPNIVLKSNVITRSSNNQVMGVAYGPKSIYAKHKGQVGDTIKDARPNYEGIGEIAQFDTYKQVFAFLNQVKYTLEPNQRISIYHKHCDSEITDIEYDWHLTESIVRVEEGEDAFNDVIYYVPCCFESYFKYRTDQYDGRMSMRPSERIVSTIHDDGRTDVRPSEKIGTISDDMVKASTYYKL
jgi:hypothetical protein